MALENCIADGSVTTSMSRTAVFICAKNDIQDKPTSTSKQNEVCVCCYMPFLSYSLLKIALRHT